MYFLVVVLLAVCILMPVVFAWRIWRLDVPTRAGWLVIVVDAAVFSTLIFLVGRWDMAGYYIRFILVALLAGVTLWSFRTHMSRPWLEDGFNGLWKSHWATFFSLVPFSAALAYVLAGMLTPLGPRDLAFPLEGGRFMVGQAGGNSLLNHHAGHLAQRYAADIGAIFPSGFRAHGILPARLEDYAVYGTQVVSPCSGSVISAADDLRDLVPPARDKKNAIGNHVIVDCGNFNVELAHLMQGSVSVSPGAKLSAGARIGKVGNSGNTTEPHLHIHAVNPRTGRGVPMRFNGRVPVRNSVYP